MSQNLQYLASTDESDEGWYNSRAVFSDVGAGVEVEDYDNFRLYKWETDYEFDKILEELEPLHPLALNPALEMIREKDRVRTSDRDHVEMENKLVYDPVRDWEEDRWSEYSLIQINLTDGDLIFDQKEQRKDGRLRAYIRNEESDLFENIFPRTVDDGHPEDIVEDVKNW